MQSVGASGGGSGNLQGAVFNVLTRQGSDRFRSDASLYGQTSRPDHSAREDTARSRPAVSARAGTNATGTGT